MSDATFTHTRLGRYEVMERIGRGGMAQVFKARDTNLDRIVAVKVLYENLSDDETFKERFEQEAKFVASFNHPNIVQVYDFDRVERGGQHIYYMVMPLIPGHTLKDELAELMEKGRLMPRHRALQITRNIAEALDYAHQRGMVHRDVKPGNILFDERDQAVLTDFGIARLVEKSNLTQEGLTVGTPAYMSPEQAAGEPVDARSDIYALGVIAYEMLAGNPPFGNDSSLSVLLKHLNEPVPSVSTFTHMPDPALDAALFRALEKHPSDRYTTARDFADALESALTSTGDVKPILPKSEIPKIETPISEITPADRPTSTPNNTLTYMTRQLKTVTRSPLGIMVAGLAIVVFLLAASLISQRMNDASARSTGDVDAMTREDVESMTGEDAESMTAPPFYFNNTFDADDAVRAYWPLTVEEQVERTFTDDGFFRFVNNRIDRGVTTIYNSPNVYRDIALSMKATLEAGSSAASGYGIIFRYVNPDHYNVFTVDGMGRFSIWARREGNWFELRSVGESWTEADAVNPVGEPNAIAVEILGDTFTGYVNGKQVVEVTDDSFDEGGIGIYLASTSAGGASLLVDSFTVRNVTPAMTAPER